MNYNLAKIGNRTYALLNDTNTAFSYYLTVSEDGDTIRLSGDGITTIYTFEKELIYS